MKVRLGGTCDFNCFKNGIESLSEASDSKPVSKRYYYIHSV